MDSKVDKIRKELIPDRDFDLHNENTIIKEISILEDFLRENENSLNNYEIEDLEKRLKYRDELLKEIRRNRCDFEFKEDVIETTSPFEIDKQLRDKLKDANFRGRLSKEEANRKVRKINASANR